MCADPVITTDDPRPSQTEHTMLTNPTIETLKSLKLHGMIEALEEQQQTPAIQGLSFEERIALIVDRERLYRNNQRRTRLLRGAHLKVAAACVEDINYKAARGLDKRQIATLASGEWIRRAQNLLITGATGSGKTWLACALAQQNMTIDQFEADLKRQVMITRLRDIAMEGTIVTQSEIEAAFRKKNEKIKVEFVRLTADKYKAESQPTTQEMLDF